MKHLIFVFIFFVIFSFSLCKYSHHGQKKLHHKHKQTPKAYDLKNHFGYPSEVSPYGPHHQEVVVVNTISAPEVVSPCEISIQPYYDICSPLLTCGSCASSPYCGWCAGLQQCLPGNFDSCSCSGYCLDQWYFQVGFCPRLFVQRRINLVNPEIAKPKLHVISEHSGTVRQTEMVGSQETHNLITSVDEPTGEVLREDITTQKPVYGTVERPFSYVKHDVVNLDGSPQQPDVIKYHGFD